MSTNSLPESKKLHWNVASLSVLQMINFGLTIVMLPYLARTLGVTGWGYVAFVQLVINYMLWIANWGFYLGATKRVAAARNEPTKLAEILSTTLAAQWLLTGILGIVLVAGLNLMPEHVSDKPLYLVASGLLLGNVLTPIWYLNGLEKIREAALLQLAVKILTIPMIFLFVHEKSDTVVYLAINSASSIVIGAGVMYTFYKNGELHKGVPKIHDVWQTITADFQLFLGALWANLNGSLIPTVLGILGGATQLGYYSLAERAKSAAITVLHPITQALFPRMCYLFSHDQGEARKLLRQSGSLLFVLSAIMSLILFVFARDILTLLGGSDFQEGTYILRWMSMTALFSTISAFMTHQIIIPSGRTRSYNIAMLSTLVVNMLCIVPAVSLQGAEGAAAVLFVTELFTVVYLVAYAFRYRLHAVYEYRKD